MNKEVISDNQGIALIVFIIIADKIIFAVAAKAQADFWMAIILAIIISTPILLIFARLNVLFPDKNLFDITEYIFGKFLGKLFNLLFVFYVSYNALVILDSFANFVNTVSLPETPIIIPTIGFMFICAWAVKEGIEVMGRCSILFLLFGSTMMLSIVLLLIPQMDKSNIYPVFYNGIKPILNGALKTVGFPFTETIMFTMIFSASKSKNSPNKIYLLGLIIGGLTILIFALAEVLVLGVDIYLMAYFPAHTVSSILKASESIQRFEIIPSTGFLLAGFTKLSICLLAISKGFSKIFHFNEYRFLVTPITLLITCISIIFTDSMMSLFTWANEIFPKFAIPFQVILPIIVLIGAEIKKKGLENKPIQ